MFAVGRQLDWDFDPLEALARWPEDRRALLLHSGRYDPRWAQRSILAEPVGFYHFAPSSTGYLSQWKGPSSLRMNHPWRHKPFVDLRRMVAARRMVAGLWIGYLSYDLGRWVEKLPTHAEDDRHWPIIELGYCPGYLIYDQAERRWTACGGYERSGEPDLNAASPHEAPFTAAEPLSVFNADEYEAAVARVIDYIAAGDVFQVNLAQRLTAALRGTYPLAHRTLYGHLATVSPAWYGAYLELDEQRVVASTSPELFLRVDRTGHVTTRPIKGTRPATVSAERLRHSGKDTAELNMIVDLMRNDLGRVCSYGSIDVPDSRVIESHPTIHHGVATITGRLHQGKNIFDLLRATMPGGSVTGSPKIRAMQIIDELEPVRRGPYCGCIGYLSQESACLNIAIRTMLIDAAAQRVDFSVGAGIVADSQPATEYQETLDKAAPILEALRQCSLEKQEVAG